MKLTIDINDNEYLSIKNYPDAVTSYPITIHLYDAVRNGIPHETVTEFADRCRECGREKVLNKIRVEIEQNAYPIVHGVNNHEKGMTLYGILQILDKYRNEVSE